MPIRTKAAERLARVILEPYVAFGLANDEIVANLANMIRYSVELDECDAAEEAKERLIRDIGKGATS